ncbi:hypothetical protein GCM10010166_10880 [Couchioplanes caeruleus subsp. azureus]|nr:hypothetical protein GCM10010166_10880 [Couchioplanes caeruleus subsp. azureus]
MSQVRGPVGGGCVGLAAGAGGRWLSEPGGGAGVGRSVDQAAAACDQFADAGAAEALGLGGLAGRLRVGQSGEELEPATATIRVESLRYVGHEAETAEPSGVRQGRVRCATGSVLIVDDTSPQSWTFTIEASLRW